MEKILAFLKKNIHILITILCSSIVISLIYYMQDVTPFGKHSMLQIDFYHQYGPMLGELYDRVKSGSSLLFSFNTGLGIPFYRNFLNYLSSPFNLLIFLFKRENLLIAFSLIIGLKTVASATSMSYYLGKKFKKNNLLIASLSVLYSFSAYFAAYNWNIMWLDGMVFLPLIIYGIENIVDKNKSVLYIVTLSIMLFSNYFIGYMICLFSVLYFISYLFIKTKKINYKFIFKKIGKFALASIIAGGLVAALLIPLFIGLRSISATSDMWPASQYYKFNFLEFIAHHYSGVGTSVLASGKTNAPNISTGIISLTLFILFFINSKINLKTKIGYGFLILILTLSFFIVDLDFIWHAFHVPNDLPYRYSFLYSFVFIIIATYSLFKIKHIKIRDYTIVSIVLLIGPILMFFLKYDNINNSMIFLNILLLSLLYILFILYKKYPTTINKIPYLVLLLSILDTFISVDNNLNISQDAESFYSNYEPYQNALTSIEDESFYRLESTSKMTYNDPSWYGYYGQMAFSSMAYENMAVFQNNLGMPGNYINSYYYKENTPVYNLMFNIKYFLGSSWDINRYTLNYFKEDLILFKANFNTNLFYATHEDIKNLEKTSKNPFDLQNNFAKYAFNIDEVLERQNFISKDLVHEKNKLKIYKYSFENKFDNYYFQIDKHTDFIIINDVLYYNNKDFSDLDDIEDIDFFTYENLKENFIIPYRNDEDKTFNIYVGYYNYLFDDFNAYKINDDKFNNLIDKTIENKFNITNFEEDKIEGNINLKENKTIYSSISYDEGWTVYDNGKKIKTFKISDTLLAFDLKEGNHNIKLIYFPTGMKAGMYISGISFVSLIIIYFIERKKKFKF